MNWQRGGTVTALNLVILFANLMMKLESRPAAQAVPEVLRGRGLEIVDDQGRVRAEIKVFPAASPTSKMPDGYPETVLLRLITSKGGPNVKLSTLEDGSGLVLAGSKGYAQLLSRDKDPTIKIVTKDGREQTIK